MKTPKLDSELVGKWLSKLTDVEVIDFFYQQMRDRDIYRGEGRTHRESHLALAVASRDNDEPWQLQMLAPAAQKWTSDSPICQFGFCAMCGHATASVSKDAQCPVCFSDVRGG